jgi:hypothetical protein
LDSRNILLLKKSAKILFVLPDVLTIKSIISINHKRRNRHSRFSAHDHERFQDRKLFSSGFSISLRSRVHHKAEIFRVQKPKRETKAAWIAFSQDL